MSLFTDAEHRVLQALAARIFPPHPQFPESGANIDFAPQVERYFANVDPILVQNLKRAIFAFERGAHLSRLSARPFSRLSPDEQDKYIHAWAESGFYPRRTVFNALKVMLTMVYTSQPSVEQAIGYAGLPAEAGAKAGSRPAN